MGQNESMIKFGKITAEDLVSDTSTTIEVVRVILKIWASYRIEPTRVLNSWLLTAATVDQVTTKSVLVPKNSGRKPALIGLSL